MNTKIDYLLTILHITGQTSLFGQIHSLGFFNLLFLNSGCGIFKLRKKLNHVKFSGRDCTQLVLTKEAVSGRMDGGGRGPDWGQRLGWNLRVRQVTFQVTSGYAGCLFIKQDFCLEVVIFIFTKSSILYISFSLAFSCHTVSKALYKESINGCKSTTFQCCLKL